MELIFDGIWQAGRILLQGDPEVLQVVFLSLQVSLTATLISTVLGISGGAFLALKRFPGRKILIGLVNTGMGVPPVAAGLLVTLLLWRSGPFGALQLLYSPAAMIIAQTGIALPIVCGITVAALQQIPADLPRQLYGLGASRGQMLRAVFLEARLPLLAAIMAGFGGVISEVGASMMVGGNIKGQTRVLTTAMVMETSKGNFETALALGIILLLITYLITMLLTFIQQRDK